MGSLAPRSPACKALSQPVAELADTPEGVLIPRLYSSAPAALGWPQSQKTHLGGKSQAEGRATLCINCFSCSHAC